MCKGTYDKMKPISRHPESNHCILGDELDAYLARKGEHFDRIIYVGDGSNDFCPILRLRP